MRHNFLVPAILALAVPVAPAFADATLRGSRSSVRHQHEIARDADLTFLRTPSQVREFVEKERLERVVSTADLTITKVSFPYTRPIVKTFLERLAAQYRAATGKALVVTSLTRPQSRQPRNASPLSVHPAGIAVDFRVPSASADRFWLEATLLMLEDQGLLDVTRERRPPHYHVAVFPEQYEAYVATRLKAEAEDAAKAPAVAAADAAASTERLEETVQIPQPSVTETADERPSFALLVLFAGVAMSLTAGGLVLRRT